MSRSGPLLRAQAARAPLLVLAVALGCRFPPTDAVPSPPGATPHVLSGLPPRGTDQASTTSELLAHTADADRRRLLERALSRNASLEAARQRWLAEQARVPQARSFDDPQLSVRGFIEEVQTRTGPQEWGVGISQALPGWGKRRLRGRMAEERARAARARYENEQRMLVLDVEHTWMELLFLANSERILEQNHALFRRLEEVVNTRYASGEASYADWTRAQIETRRLANELASLADRRRPLEAHLRRLLGEGPPAPLALPKNLPPVTTWPPAAELRDRLEAEHPLLRALRHDVAAAAEGVSLAGIASRPDSRLSLEYIHLGDPLTPVPDASEDPLVASLTFPVPLRTARYRGMRREAQALRNAAAYELEDALVRLEAEIEEALFLRRDAERRRALYAEDLVSLVAQVFESTETAYRTGAATFFELVDAEHRRLEFELALVRAEHDRAVAEATLRALCGDAGGPESLDSPAPRR